MARPKSILLALGVTLLFLAAFPLAAAQQSAGIQNPNESTETTLYMHIDGIQDFPINTQPPDDRFQKGNPYGLNTITGSCLGSPEGTGLATGNWHTYYGYSSPGYVEYDFEEQGKPRYHPERGLSFDVDLDTNSPFTTYWYLETQVVASDLAGDVDPNTAPMVIPNVVVRATMRSGDDVKVGDEGFNEGEVIAEGQTQPVTMSPATTEENPDVDHSEVDGKHVYEFAVPMEYRATKIDKDESYNIRIDVFMENPMCADPQYDDEDKALMANNVRVHTSPSHRPRMEMAVMNPLRIEYLHPQFIGDEMVIHTSLNSPWGNYDVGETEGPYATPQGIQLSIEGPTPASSLYRAAFTQRHHEHNHHQEAVDVTYIWPYKDDGAQQGVYTVKMAVKNDQETATATGEVQFQIGKGDLPPCDPDVPVKDQVNCVYSNPASTEGKDSPGVGLLALLGALAAVVLTLRRRG